MKVKTDYEGCEYITAGKEYEATSLYPEDIQQTLFSIEPDSGNATIRIFLPDCCHLNDQPWEIVE